MPTFELALGPSSSSPPTTPTATPTTVRSSTTSSPYVTLEPTNSHGQIPGDASDPADFYGIILALAAIVLVVVLVRLAFRGRGGAERGPRS